MDTLESAGIIFVFFPVLMIFGWRCLALIGDAVIIGNAVDMI